MKVKMIKIFLRKFRNGLSKSNNGLFKNYLYELRKNEAIKVQPKLPIYEEFITQNNCERVIEMVNSESYKKGFRGMLDQGQIGLFAIYNNRAVGYSWAYIGNICNKIKKNKKRLNDLVKLRDDEALIHFCSTAEEYRGRGVYSFLLFRLSDILFLKYNIKKIYIDTDIKNISSQKGIERTGFRKIYLVKRLKILSFSIFRNFKKIS